MSNEYVIASAQFLKESWYRENAGTPEIQEAKLLDQVFEEIVDYCIESGFDIDESVDIASEIIEEGLVEEFYEEFLKEIAPSISQQEMERNRQQSAQQAARQEKIALSRRTGVAAPRSGNWMSGGAAAIPTAPNQRAYGTQLGGRQGVVVKGAAASGGGSGFKRAASNITLGGQTLYKAQKGKDIVYLQRQGSQRLFNQQKPTAGNTPPASQTPTAGNNQPKPTVPTTGSSGGRGGNLGMGGNRPLAPQALRTPQAPRRVASTLGSASTASASTTPIVPTAPAVPSTTPTMAKLGQGSQDSIFNKEGGRQEYEKRMRQAIRTGTKYQPASTGAPVSSSTSNIA